MLGPEFLVMGQPCEGVLQRRGREPAGDGASGLCARNQAGVGQDVEMLHDRRQRNVERRFQRADRKPGLAGEPQHQRAPRRVGQRRKGAIEGGGVKVNHVVNYSAALRSVNRFAPRWNFAGGCPSRRAAGSRAEAALALTVRERVVTLKQRIFETLWPAQRPRLRHHVTVSTRVKACDTPGGMS